ncbi:MAG: UTP--glucose-1-phosphate uridylyltransferase [Candidatus Caenarcaniphilales bacterium]|nr:UTP--glucose-1-phosphate uridylyltransferase [Candidatus Caenarcaniphilales bacterium]
MGNSKSKIKGVIFAAGYGTRFLPASKTVPKELFPLIDVPAIDFTVKEFLDSGIQDILIITSRRKKVLEDYLDHEMELESILQQEGDEKKLTKIAPLNANFHFVRQREMKGTADALGLCKSFCGNSPFVVAYPDDLIFSQTPCSKQLIDAYQKTGKTILTVRELPDEDVSRYGVIAYSKAEDNIYNVTKLVEKPPKGTEPSKVVSFGRYLYTPDIFDALDKVQGDPNKREISQTEPLNFLAAEGKVAALEFEGTRHDVGAPFGYLTTIIEYGLMRNDLSGRFKEYLKKNYERLVA